MTAIAVIAATALLVAVATLAIVQAVRGAEQAAADTGSDGGKPVVVLAVGSRERQVLLRVLAAAVFVATATALWYSSPVAEALAAWSEAALPAWLDWLV